MLAAIALVASLGPDSSGCAAGDNPDDCAALLAINRSTTVGWPGAGRPLCTWRGVVCSSAIYARHKTRRVDGLDLTAGSLAGTVPSEIGLLSTMTRTLGLSVNSLSGTVPTQLGALSALSRTLDLTGNTISGTLPSQASLSLYPARRRDGR
jgi:hypothetical protein